MKKTLITTLFLISLICINFSGCLEEENTPSKSDPYVLTEGLQGCWMFEETWVEQNNITYDCSSNENHGMIQNAHQELNTIIGNNCASFNGSEQYINISSDNLNLNKITVEAWVKSSNPGGSFSYILSKGSQNCDSASYAFYTDTNNGICFYVSDGVQNLKSPNPGSEIWDNTWHHVAGTYDGETIRLFIDGSEIQNGIKGNISINYNLSTGDDLIIGNFIGSCQLPYQGLIDNVMIWNKPLSHDDIYQHFLYGALDDSSQQSEPQYVSFSNAQSYLKTFLAPYTVNDILIIKGSNLSIQDNFLLTTIATRMENTEDVKLNSDNSINQDSLDNYSLLVLLGSEKTNRYSEHLITSNLFNQTSLLISTPLILQFGTNTANNQEILIVYTISEKENNKNHASDKSPLNSIIDKKYVTIIATSTSILLLFLWSILGNTISEFIFDFISEHIAEKKIKKLKKYAGKKLISKRNKIFHESIALILAITVFSVAMSWTWSEDHTEFKSLILVNFFIISIIFLIREGLRTHLSKKYMIDTAHVFWPFGSLLTFGSTILGNTFSLASFTMLSNENDQKKFGKMYYFIFKVLYIIGLLFFIINM